MRIQTGRILERGQLDLTNLRHPFLAGDRHRHGAVVAHRHIAGAGRDGDGGRQRHAIGVHQLPLRIRMEGAIAGIAGRAVGHLQLEETVAADGQVEAVAGLLQVALREQTRRGHRPHTGTQLQSGRQLRVGRGLRPHLPHVLVDQVFKYGLRTLVAIGAHVGQVVRDHVHLRLLRIQTGLGNPQRSNHLVLSPVRPMRRPSSIHVLHRPVPVAPRTGALP